MENKDFTLYNTLKNTTIYDVKYELDGYISMKIIDYYDFSSSNNVIVDNAYRQQQNGHLKNYALIIPIRINSKDL